MDVTCRTVPQERNGSKKSDAFCKLRGDQHVAANSRAVAVVRWWRRVLRIFKVGKSRRDRDRGSCRDYCRDRLPVWRNSSLEQTIQERMGGQIGVMRSPWKRSQ